MTRKLKIFLSIFVYLLALTVAKGAFAATCNDQADGAWNETATWDCGIVPDADDDVTIDSHTVTMTADSLSNTVIISGGTLNMGSFIHTNDAGWTHSSGTINSQTSTLTFPLATLTFTPGSAEYYNVKSRSGGTKIFTLSGNATVLNDLTIDTYGNYMTINGDAFIVHGDFYQLGTFGVNGSASIELVGTDDQSIYPNGMSLNLSIEIDKPSGTLSLFDTLNTSGDWTWVRGIFDAGTSTLRLNRTGGLSFTPGDVFYYNVTMNPNSAGGGSDVYLQDDLRVTNNLTIDANYFGHGLTTNNHNITAKNIVINSPAHMVAGSSGVKVTGDFTNNGTFTAGTSVVSFLGNNQTISGDTTFYKLYKLTNTADTLTVTAGDTLTIGTGGVMRFWGKPEGKTLSVVSSSPGTPYTITKTGTAELEYTNWSDATWSAAQVASASSLGTGNTNLSVTKEFISTIKSTGGDYATLSGWEDAVETDLTAVTTKVFSHGGITGIIADGATVTGATSGATATVLHASATQILVQSIATSTFQSGEQMQVDGSNYATLSDAGFGAIATAECYNDWASGLADTLTIDGWVVDANHYTKVYVPRAERHIGKLKDSGGDYTGFTITAASQNNYNFIIEDDYVRVDGIAMDVSTQWLAKGIYPHIGGTERIILSNILHYGGDSVIWGSGKKYLTNSIFIDSYISASFGDFKAYNVTVADHDGAGFGSYSADVVYKNCLADTTTGFSPDSNGGTVALNNSASFDATADDFGGSGNRPGQTFSFIDEDNDDFHLVSKDTGAKNHATDLSVDPDFPVIDDIDGEMRPVWEAWDIGADEVSNVEFISTIRASGGDYSSLSSWETAVQTDLTASTTRVFSHLGIIGTIVDGDAVTGATSGATASVVHTTTDQILLETISGTFISTEQVQVDALNYVAISDEGHGAIAVAECYNDWPSGMEADLNISGWTTSATNYVKVYAPEGQRHNGKDYNSGFWIKETTGWDSGIDIIEPYTKISFIGFNPNNQGSIGMNIGTDYVDIDSCILYRLIPYYQVRGITYGNRNNSTTTNCIAIGMDSGFYLSGYNTDVVIYNSSAFKCNVGFFQSSVGDKAILRNNVSFDNNESNWSSVANWHADSSNNASDASDAALIPGDNSVTGIVSADFVDLASRDFHLSADSALKNVALDLSATFTTDIDGETRNVDGGGWDIGADESDQDFISKIRINTESDWDFDKISTWEDAIESDLTVEISRVYTVLDAGTFDDTTDKSQAVTFTGGGTGTLLDISSSGIAYIVGVSGTVQAGTVTIDTNSHTFVISNTGAQIGRAVAECYNDWSSGLDDSFWIAGWTTNANNYLKIYTPESERHNGIPGSGFYLNKSLSAAMITASQPYTHYLGIEIRNTHSSGTSLYGNSTDDSAYQSVDSCILYSNTGYNSMQPGTKISNSLVKAYTPGSGTGITTGYWGNVGREIFNNTVIDYGTGIFAGSQGNNDKLINNVTLGNTNDYTIGTIHADSTHNASDAFDDVGIPGDNSVMGITTNDFSDITSNNYHLSSSSKLKNVGYDLSTVFTTDIDGETRDIDNWGFDIGADEAPTSIYRSVGPSNTSTLAADSSHTNTITLSDGVATFSASLADNIGVGDAVLIDTGGTDQTIDSSDTILFIQSRTDSTHYTLQTEAGIKPADIAVNDTYNIYRAYTSLVNAEAGTKNTSIPMSFTGGNRDLVANKEQWNLACYADTTDTSSLAEHGIYGWITSESNYLKIYTPVTFDEVGISQRHNGIAGTGYYLDTSAGGYSIKNRTLYLTIDGLEISTAPGHIGIDTYSDMTRYTNVRNSILHNIGYVTAIIADAGEIENCIIYDFGSSSTGPYVLSSSKPIRNCTIYADGGGAYSGQMILRGAEVYNTAIYNTTIGGYNDFYDCTGDHNASSDGSAPGSNSITNLDLYDFDFKSVTSGAEDFHLGIDSQLIDTGDDLSLNFTTDIDGHLRTEWDIGADEASIDFNPTVMQSGGDYSTLTLWETGVQTDLTLNTTRVFSHGGKAGIIVDGDLVTGATSGSTATAVHASAEEVLLENISGTFVSGEQVQVDASNYVTVSNAGNPANAVAKIDGAWTAAETSPLYINGWTTGPQNIIRIYTTDSARHKGQKGTGYQLVVDGTYALVYYNDYVWIDGLELAGNSYSVTTEESFTKEFKFSNNLVYGGGWTVGGAVKTGTYKVWNNVFHSDNDFGIYGLSDSNPAYFYNNTFYHSMAAGNNQHTAIYGRENVVAKNNNAYGYGGISSYKDFTGSFHADSTNNISSDDSAPGSNPTINVNVVFADAGNKDFHLSSSDTVSKNAGMSLVSDNALAFSTDIDGTSRGGTWDIGADEIPIEFETTIMETGGDFATLLSWEGATTADLTVPTTRVFSHGGITGAIAGDASVTGVTSSTTATVVWATSDQILLDGISGTFVSGEQLQVDVSNYVTISDLGEPASFVAKIDGVWTAADAITESLVVDGRETDEDNFLKIYTTDPARHNGTWDTGAYRLELTSSTQYDAALRLSDEYFTLDGLQILTNVSNNAKGIEITTGDGENYISNNIVKGTTSDDYGILLEGGNSNHIYNNVIYDWNQAGIFFDNNSNNTTSYLLNNTVENISVGYGIGFSGGVVGSVVVKNNITQNTNSNGFYGTFGADSGYNISSDATAPGASSKHDITISFENLGAEDYHLIEPEPNARSFGENLSAYAPNSFVTDIDGQIRPQDEKWDVGADEVTAATTLYRSVGTNSADLNTGSATVEIVGTTATFSAGLDDKIGVGDVLQYGTPTLAFITSRTSDAVFEISNSTGGNPTTATAGTAVSIYRAYSSLANWESQTENTSFDDTVENFDTSTDLSASNARMFVACYGDGTDTTAVSISGWTTGVDNYIKIYTLVSSSEVGVSQRHEGTWDDTKFNIKTDGNYNAIDIKDDYVYLEGLQIQGSYNNVTFNSVIVNRANNTRVSNSIIVGNHGVLLSGALVVNSIAGTIYLWNDVIYFTGETVNRAGISSSGIGTTVYAYNNTIYNYQKGFVTADSGEIIAKNNITQNCTDGFDGTFDSSSDYNISDLASDAPGANSKNDVTVKFRDVIGKDFHVTSDDTVAIDAGADLSADENLSLTTDIDGHSRSTWDIGADEASIDFDPTVMQTGGDYSTLALWEAGVQTDLTADTTRVFSHGGKTGTILNGDLITGMTSDATATVVHASDTQILLENISGTFVSGEQAKVGSSNYVTLSNAGNPANAVAKIDGFWDAADTTPLLIDGWGSSLNNNIRVYTAYDARHHGKWDDSAYSLEISNATIVSVSESYVQIDGLQIAMDGTTGYVHGIRINDCALDNVAISNNIITDKAVDLDRYGIYSVGASNTNIKIYNNIIYDVYKGMIVETVNQNGFVYSNTISNTTDDCGSFGYNDVYLVNNIAQNCGADSFKGDFYYSSNNLDKTDDVRFADEANRDFHLSFSDTVARDVGTDSVFTDTNLNFTTDIDGTPRGAGVDIGADEVPVEFVSTICENTSAGGDCANLDYNTLAFWEAEVDSDLTAKTTRVYTGAKTGTLASGSIVMLMRSAVSTGITAVVEAVTSDQILIRDIAGTNAWEMDGFVASANDVWEKDASNYWTVTGTGDDFGASVKAVAKIDGDWANTDPTTACITLYDWDTDNDNSIKIYTTDLARHDGKWSDSAYRYKRITAANYSGGLKIAEHYVTVDGLQIEYDNSIEYAGSSGLLVDSINGKKAEIYLSNNIIKATASTAPGSGIGFGNNSHDEELTDTYIYNNLVYDFTGYGIYNYYSNKGYLYNNTVVNCATGYRGASLSIYKNNIAQDCTNGFFDSIFNATSDFNISDIASDAYNATFSTYATEVLFEDAMNKDFHLALTDTSAKDQAIDLSSDSNLAFSVDIDGDNRVADWDIGADQAPRDFVSKIRASGGDYDKLSTWEAAIESDLTSTASKVFTVSDVGTYVSATDDGTAVTFAGGATGTLKKINTDNIAYITGVSAGNLYEGTVTLASGHTFVVSDTGAKVGRAIAECYNDWANGLSDQLIVEGWTTGVSNYVKIYTPLSERHAGKTWDGSDYSGFALVGNNDWGVIQFKEDYSVVDGVILNANGYNKGFRTQGSQYSTIENAIVFNTTGAAYNVYIGGGNLSIINCIGYNSGTGFSRYQWNGANIYNSTFYNNDIGIDGSSDGSEYTLVKNTISVNNTNGDFIDTGSKFNSVSSNNISSDATAPGSSSRINTAAGQIGFISITANFEDLHISKDSVVVGAGIDLSATFSTDIDSENRFASATINKPEKDTGLLSWDIGADQTATGFVSHIRAATEADADSTTLSSWEAVVQSDLTADTTRVFFYDKDTANGGIPNASLVIGEDSGATGTAVTLTKTTSTAQMLLTGISGTFQNGEKVYIQGHSADADFVYLASPGLSAMAVAECYNDWSTGLVDGHTSISGWTTSAENYVKVYTPVSERHNGVAMDGSNYTGFALVNTSTYYTLQASSPYSRIEGIIIDQNNMGGSYAGFDMASDFGSADAMIVFNSSGIGINLESYVLWTNPIYLSNSISYNNDGAGLYIPYVTSAYNITLVNNGGAGILKNNSGTAYNKNILSYGNTGGDFVNTGSGTFDLENSLSSDGTADDFSGTGNQIDQTVQFVDEENDDFHLASSDVAARNKGVDMNNDTNYSFSTDIDGDERGIGSWDIGADETSSEIFRSVGPSNVTTLQNGSGNNLTISGSTATFSSAISDNVGIGDAIQYDSTDDDVVDSIAFVHRRISNTQFTIKKNTGESPTITTSADQDWDIFRAYTSLSNAESGIENTGIIESLRNFDDWTVGGDALTDDIGKDLAAENQRWNIACYKDAVDIANVVIDGWTTNDTSVLKIFAPARLNEVGTSQKHKGIKDTGFKLQTAGGFGITTNTGIIIEGLEIENTLNGSDQGEVLVSGANYSFATIRESVIYGGISGIETSATFGTKLEIYNNFIFDAVAGIRFDNIGANSNVFIYNNTIADCDSGILQNVIPITSTVKNTIVVNSLVEDFDINSGTMDIYSSLSSDSTADNFGGSGNFVDQTVSFQDEAADNFHLQVSDTVAREKGTDLSADASIPFWLDIDGEARAYGVAWDIGADESVDTNATIHGGVNIKGGVEIKN